MHVVIWAFRQKILLQNEVAILQGLSSPRWRHDLDPLNASEAECLVFSMFNINYTPQKSGIKLYCFQISYLRSTNQLSVKRCLTWRGQLPLAFCNSNQLESGRSRSFTGINPATTQICGRKAERSLVCKPNSRTVLKVIWYKSWKGERSSD